MPVYAKEVSTKDRRFAGRCISIITSEDADRIPVPDTVVLCDGCNKNLYPDNGFLVYLGKRELKQDLPYDLFCRDCLKKYFPKAIKVEGGD